MPSLDFGGLVQTGQVPRNELVVCVLTGSGFKDFDRVLDMVRIPDRVVDSFDDMLSAAREVA